MEKENIFMERKTTFSTKERLASFYKEKKHTDCTFIVDDKKFAVHKLVLACCSPVFENMLFQYCDNEIKISDIAPEHFEQVLDFIYIDNINLSSMNNAWSIYYIANKYLLESLRVCCLEFIWKNISMHNLVMCYEYAEMYNLPDVKQKCFSDITNYLKAVFSTDYHMKPSTLRVILQQNHFNHVSSELVMDVLIWAVDECNFRNISIEPKQIINLLDEENLLKHIEKQCWFKTCDSCGDQISSCKCCDKILRDTLLLILEKPNNIQKETDPNCGMLRASSICRTRKEYKIAGRIDLWPYDTYVTKIIVGKSVIVFGILIKTVMNPGYINDEVYNGSITVKIVDEQTNYEVMNPTTVKDSMPYDDQYYVNFKSLAKLYANKTYKIIVSFVNLTRPGSSSIHCYYMSNPLFNETNDCSLYFDENWGSVIKGVTYYPL